MKKILQTLCLIITNSIIVFAQNQLSNGGFENWTLETRPNPPYISYYSPDNWMNGVVCASINNGPESCTFKIARTTDAYAGNYAVSHYNSNNNSDISYFTFANYGKGFTLPAFTGRPSEATFYYKFATDDNQPMIVTFFLLNGSILSKYDTIAYGTYEFSTPQKTYTKATVKLDYKSNGNPTNIFISSNYKNKPVTALDTVKLDNINFVYTSNGIEDELYSSKYNLTLYPNPAKEVLIVKSNSIPTAENITLKIYNYQGVVVKYVPFTEQELSISLEDIPSGLYFIQGIGQSQRFVIE